MLNPEKNPELTLEQRKAAVVAKNKLYIEAELATKTLFYKMDIEFIKENTDRILAGWLASDYIASVDAEERSNLYYCVSSVFNFVEKNKTIKKPSQLIEERDLFFFDFKFCKECIQKIVYSFLTTGEANDKEDRVNALACSDYILDYLKTMYSLKKKIKLNL